MRLGTLSSRVFLAAAVSVGILLLVTDFWAISRWQQATLPEYAGSLGASLGPADFHYRAQIKALSDDSPLRAAGAQAGDELIFDRASDRGRFLAKNEPIGLRLFHGADVRHLELPASAANTRLDTLRFFFLDWASLILCVLCGMWVAIRRPESGPHRVLCALLLINGTGTELALLPPGALHDGLMFYGWNVTGFIEFQLFVLFALVFPENAPLLRHRWVRRLFVAQLLPHAAYVLYTIARSCEWSPLAWVDPGLPLAYFQWQLQACVYGGLAALCVSLWRNTGLARQQTLWATVSVGVLYLSFSVPYWLSELGRPDVARVVTDLIAVARCGASILLAYALLSRRMLNIGFAINRALVMAVISSLLLMLFGISEFAVDKLLHFHGRESSIIIDAAVALAIILSFHRIQHWVNHYVNHFFFHQWEAAATSLRRFMASASHITDVELLQEKFVAAVARFADADSIAIYQQEGDKTFSLCHASTLGLPAAFQIDDDAVVALRHAREPLEWGQLWLFPMMVRGEVRGMVLVGPKRDGHGLRTDEITLLEQSVHQLALDVVSLRAALTESRATKMEKEHGVLVQHVVDLERLCAAQEREAAALRQLASQPG